MKLCDAESPQGRRLMALAALAMESALPLLVEGAPGRPLEEFVLHIRGAPTRTGDYSVEHIELVDFAALATHEALGGAVGPGAAIGHVTVCVEAEGLVLLGMKALPAGVFDLRRLHELSVTAAETDESPAPESLDMARELPFVRHLQVQTIDGVDDAVRAALNLGVDFATTLVFVQEAEDFARAPPTVHLADRAAIMTTLLSRGFSAEDFSMAEGYAGVVYLARDGLALRRVSIDDVRARPTKQDRKATTKVGRNELCPCGSGRKFKHCCLN